MALDPVALDLWSQEVDLMALEPDLVLFVASALMAWKVDLVALALEYLPLLLAELEYVQNVAS